jgi:hypothetical protein
MLSLLQIPLRMTRCLHQGEKVPFQPLLKNFGESGFQKVDFSATFSPMFKDLASGPSKHLLALALKTWENQTFL